MRNKLLGSIRGEVQKFKELVKETFDAHCKMWLFALKFHLLDHAVKDRDLYGSLILWNTSAFERFNVHI